MTRWLLRVLVLAMLAILSPLAHAGDDSVRFVPMLTDTALVTLTTLIAMIPLATIPRSARRR